MSCRRTLCKNAPFLINFLIQKKKPRKKLQNPSQLDFEIKIEFFAIMEKNNHICVQLCKMYKVVFILRNDEKVNYKKKCGMHEKKNAQKNVKMYEKCDKNIIFDLFIS